MADALVIAARAQCRLADENLRRGCCRGPGQVFTPKILKWEGFKRFVFNE
jgi:hypothetical protein